MGWTTVYTFTAGELITADTMNTYLRDNLLYLKGSASAVTIENDLTVASLTTVGLVDGVDLSVHASGQVVSQHAAGVGTHTHYSTEEQGNTLSVTAVVSTNRISLAQMPAGDYGLFFRGTGSTSPEYNNR